MQVVVTLQKVSGFLGKWKKPSFILLRINHFFIADEFDMFAQSRQYDATQHSTAASYAFQSEAGQNAPSMGSAAAGKDNPYTQVTKVITLNQTLRLK